MTKPPTKHERAKVRTALMRKYWGNAYMGRTMDSVPTTTFAGLQSARLESWRHGMQVGFAAGVRLARKNR